MIDIKHIIEIILVLLFKACVFIIRKAAHLIRRAIEALTRHVIIPLLILCYECIRDAVCDMSQRIRTSRYSGPWDPIGPPSRVRWGSRRYDGYGPPTSPRRRR